MPFRDRQHLEQIRKNTKLDVACCKVTTAYPVIGDLSKLKDNQYQFESVQRRKENMLLRTGKKFEYDEQFKANVERGTLKDVSEELAEYKGAGNPIHFISHHSVEKESSVSTPLRIVWNGALKKCSTGPSCNDLCPKGTNSINNLFVVFICWRCYTIALVWDLSKAYNAIITSKQDNFLRLSVFLEPMRRR
jgi:hypothetical protein